MLNWSCIFIKSTTHHTETLQAIRITWQIIFKTCWLSQLRQCRFLSKKIATGSFSIWQLTQLKFESRPKSRIGDEIAGSCRNRNLSSLAVKWLDRSGRVDKKAVRAFFCLDFLFLFHQGKTKKRQTLKTVFQLKAWLILRLKRYRSKLLNRCRLKKTACNMLYSALWVRCLGKIWLLFEIPQNPLTDFVREKKSTKPTSGFC